MARKIPSAPSPFMHVDVAPLALYDGTTTDQQALMQRMAEKLTMRILALMTNDSEHAKAFREVALQEPSEGSIRVIRLFLRAGVRDIEPPEKDEATP